MRSPAILLSAALAVSAGSCSGHLAAASETVTRRIEARAEVVSRTSLTVSSELLRFVLTDSGQPAIATVDFVARARTRAGAEVVLTIEPERGVDGPSGAGDDEAAISVAGEGQGTIAGPMSSRSPVIVGKWTGSGLRSGRLSFALRASVPGTYRLPVRFVLSAL